MRLSNFGFAICIFGLVIVTFVLWWDGYWDDVVRYKLEKSFLCDTEERLIFRKDVDGDGIQEQIKIMVREYPSGHYYDEGFIEVFGERGKMFKSDVLGWEIQGAWLMDVNRDNKLEIVTKWAEGNAKCLYIHVSGKNRFEELLWASGQDVVLLDIDKDGIKEVVEYWRDSKKQHEAYTAVAYRWNGKKYVLWKQDVPIVFDASGDRLVF